MLFYIVNQQAPTPAFTRGQSCLSCHVSASTLEVPGLIVRSNHMSADGTVVPQLGNVIVDHRTPLIERWGGWFVTGDYTPQPYQYRCIAVISPAPALVVGTRDDIERSVHPLVGQQARGRGYPSTDSDIAALLAFDHQSHAIDLLRD